MLVAKLFSKIYKKGGIILEDYNGQKYICGKPDFNKPLTVKFLNKSLNLKLLINPDLSFPEAYMKGEIKIINGSLLDFLDMTFENLGRGEINKSGYFIKKSFHEDLLICTATATTGPARGPLPTSSIPTTIFPNFFSRLKFITIIL